MTELEKKADKYAYEVYSTRPLGDDPTDDEIKEAYIQGYKDAMAWHYPSKGELPTEVGMYFCKIKSEYAGWNNDWYEAVGWTGKYWILNDDEQVIAWQYITPPKEEA